MRIQIKTCTLLLAQTAFSSAIALELEEEALAVCDVLLTLERVHLQNHPSVSKKQDNASRQTPCK